MANAFLTKTDGGNLRLPPSSVFCILSSALDVNAQANAEEVPPNSVVMTTFRGLSTYLLHNTGAAAYEQICAAANKPAILSRIKKDWIRLEVGEDFSFLTSGSVKAFEQMTFKKVSDINQNDPRIRVHVQLPNDQFMNVDVSDTPANWKVLEKEMARND